MKKVKIYVKTTCPFCQAAVQLLEEQKVAFEMVDYTNDWDKLEELKKQTGQQTVPMIFFDDDLIGGYDQLNQIVQQGELQNKLEA